MRPGHKGRATWNTVVSEPDELDCSDRITGSDGKNDQPLLASDSRPRSKSGAHPSYPTRSTIMDVKMMTFGEFLRLMAEQTCADPKCKPCEGEKAKTIPDTLANTTEPSSRAKILRAPYDHEGRLRIASTAQKFFELTIDTAIRTPSTKDVSELFNDCARYARKAALIIHGCEE